VYELPLAPSIATPFFLQINVGEVPPFVAVAVNRVGTPWQTTFDAAATLTAGLTLLATVTVSGEEGDEAQEE
jgi:hypothetical protein